MKRIIQLTMFLLLALSANAQIYDNEVYYYKGDIYLVDGTVLYNCVRAVLFQGQHMRYCEVYKSDLNKQRENPKYIYNKIIGETDKYEYCSSWSTQTKEVYRKYDKGLWEPMFKYWILHPSYRCFSVSKDKSSLVLWNEEENGKILYKWYFTRIKYSDVIKVLYGDSSNSSSYNTQTPSGNGYYQGTTGGGYSNMGTNNNSSQQPSTTTTRGQPTRHNCYTCNGQRRIVKNTYPSMYGMQDSQVRCSECGGYFMRSTGHTHITCPQCHGKGYFTTD